MITLYCNPSEENRVHLYLLDDTGVILEQSEHDFPRSEEILQHIDTLLRRRQISTATELRNIVFINKAESFTLVRILSTIFNAMAVSSSIELYTLTQALAQPGMAATVTEPVASKVTFITPQYSRQPNIS